MGELPPAVNGIPWINSPTECVEELVSDRYNRNCSLLAKLREDANSKKLLEACMEDFSMGRMTKPRPLEMGRQDLASSKVREQISTCTAFVLLRFVADSRNQGRPEQENKAHR